MDTVSPSSPAIVAMVPGPRCPLLAREGNARVGRFGCVLDRGGEDRGLHFVHRTPARQQLLEHHLGRQCARDFARRGAAHAVGDRKQQPVRTLRTRVSVP